MNSQAVTARTQAEPAIEIELRTAFAVWALVAAALTLLVGVSATILASKAFVPAETFYAMYKANEGLFALAGASAMVWSVFSIPFVAGLGTLLRAKSSIFALAATILTSAGVLLIGFAATLVVGAPSAAALANNAVPNAAASTYQAAFWSLLAAVITGVPQAAFGLGMVLFGWLAWRSNVLPDWLAVVSILGGVAGLVSPWLPGPFAWDAFYLLAFFILSVTTGIVLLQGRGR